MKWEIIRSSFNLYINFCKYFIIKYQCWKTYNQLAQTQGIVEHKVILLLSGKDQLDLKWSLILNTSNQRRTIIYFDSKMINKGLKIIS